MPFHCEPLSRFTQDTSELVTQTALKIHLKLDSKNSSNSMFTLHLQSLQSTCHCTVKCSTQANSQSYWFDEHDSDIYTLNIVCPLLVLKPCVWFVFPFGFHLCKCLCFYLFMKTNSWGANQIVVLTLPIGSAKRLKMPSPSFCS